LRFDVFKPNRMPRVGAGLFERQHRNPGGALAGAAGDQFTVTL
jgi:hypothetical protein